MGDLAEPSGMKAAAVLRAGARVQALALPGLAAGVMAGLLVACGASGDNGDRAARPGLEPRAVDTMPHLVDPRPLHGAGAVAFDPARERVVWAAGEELRVLALDGNNRADEGRARVGSAIADLGVAPDGALWVVADVPQLWRDGARVCRADGVEADRLLAVDGEGAVVTAYSHSDGVGALRRQVWLDAQCGVADERIAPLPDGVAGSASDPGAPLGRSTLRPLHQDTPALARQFSELRLPAGAGVERPVRVSDDGRWWVLEGAQGRTLWRRAP